MIILRTSFISCSAKHYRISLSSVIIRSIWRLNICSCKNDLKTLKTLATRLVVTAVTFQAFKYANLTIDLDLVFSSSTFTWEELNQKLSWNAALLGSREAWLIQGFLSHKDVGSFLHSMGNYTAHYPVSVNVFQSSRSCFHLQQPILPPLMIPVRPSPLHVTPILNVSLNERWFGKAALQFIFFEHLYCGSTVPTAKNIVWHMEW